jgi:hypothetical protein
MADDGKPLHRDPAKLIPLIAATLAIVISATTIYRSCQPDPPDVSVEYILDVSRRMDGRIGDKDKLRAVQTEIVEHAKNRPNVATALRLAGGPTCSSRYVPPAVGFGEDNGDDIEQALDGVTAGGKSDFAMAMTHAASDLLGREREVESESKTLFLFVGGRDTCAGDRTLTIIKQALRDLRAKENVELNLKFVGVKPPPEVRRLLRLARGEARRLNFGADVVIANRPQDLADVLPDEPTPEEDQYGD